MKKLVFILLALSMLAMACGKEETPQSNPNAPKLELTSESVAEFSAEGGIGRITYIYNPGNISGNKPPIVDIVTLKIACDAEWIDIDEESVPLGEIAYTVAQNPTTEPRETTITATLNALSFEVTVKQQAADPTPAIEGWGIVGTMNNWDTSKSIAMEEVSGYYVARAVTLSTEDKFKFIKDGDNAVNRGGNGRASDPDYIYTAQSWGSDIVVSIAGTYDIYLNAEEDTYYIMSEGKSPEEALKPIAPGEKVWLISGNFESAASIYLATDRKFLAAKGVKFSDTVAEFDIRLNNDEKIYGAMNSGTYSTDEEIAVAEGTTKFTIDVELDRAYDIFFRTDTMSLWVMPEGSRPVIWEEISGVIFSDTNAAIFLISEEIEALLDFNCSQPIVNGIIPEGTYHVMKEDGKSDFNFTEYSLRIFGNKTHPKSGTMEIKHISGGYAITIDMVSILNDVVKLHYEGPIDDVPAMGGAISNPQ